MRRRAVAVSLVALLLAAPACSRRGSRAAARTSVVALLGDRPVEYDDFATYLKKAAGDEPKNVSPRVSSSLLDQYLEELLLDLAVDAARPPAAGDTPAARRRDVITRVARISSIADDELRAEYDAHPERYRKPALIRVSQLLLPSMEKAEAARRRLAAGESWSEVSRDLSIAPNASTGGSLGLLGRSDLPRDFEKVLWGLKAGAISPILPATHGLHIFRLEERLSEKTVTFEEAAPAIRLSLAEQRTSAVVADLVAEARKANPPKVLEGHLPFPYVGTMPRVAEGR